MRGRSFSAAVMLCLLANAAPAQQTLPSASLQMGLPSAPLQTTLPSPTLPPPVAPVTAPRPDVFRPAPDTYAPRFDRQLQPDPRFFPCCGGFVGPYVLPWQPTWAAAPQRRRAPRERRFGYLQLRLRPGTAQVYVDGLYVGTVDDLRGVVPLEEGTHRVELRAAGYETASFEVRVAPDQTISYSADLEPSRPAPPPVARPPAVPKTFYVIPNCYAGDKPPTDVVLPRTCDPANVRTIPPVVNEVRPAPPPR